MSFAHLLAITQRIGRKIGGGMQEVDKARSSGLQVDDKVELVTADVTQGPE